MRLREEVHQDQQQDQHHELLLVGRFRRDVHQCGWLRSDLLLILLEILAEEGEAFLIVEGNGDLVLGVLVEVDDSEDAVEERDGVVLLVEDVQIDLREDQFLEELFLDPIEVLEEGLEFARVDVAGLADLLALAGAVKVLLIIHLQR